MNRRGRYSPANLIRSADLPSMRGMCIRLPALLEKDDVRIQWETKLRNPDIPKVLDLFAGAGGMSAGFVEEGFTVVAALDHNRSACETFAANIPARVHCADIAGIDNPADVVQGLSYSAIDVIVGGPPCQSFSTVGRARILSLEEEQKQALLARNELYQQYFRFIEYFAPAFFVMENVPALLTFNKGTYYKGIEDECRRLGYAPEVKIINAADYGVPQSRRRLIIIGSRVGGLSRWSGRPQHPHRTLREAIGDLPSVQAPSLQECMPYQSPEEPSEYQLLMRHKVSLHESEHIYDHLVRPVRDDDRVAFNRLKPGDRYVDVPEEYRRYNASTFLDKYYKLLPDQPCVTITAHMARDGYRYIHWDKEQCRTLSVREAARVQSFGDDYRFAGFRSARFCQIGNAVPPLMARALAAVVHRNWEMNRGTSQGALLQLELPGYEPALSVAGAVDD